MALLFSCLLVSYPLVLKAQYQETCPSSITGCAVNNSCTACFRECEYCQCQQCHNTTTSCGAAHCMSCSDPDYMLHPSYPDGTGICKPKQNRTFTDHISTSNATNFYLYPHDTIQSMDGDTIFTFQTDGDLVLSYIGQKLWNSNSTDIGSDGYVTFQWDRNLVVHNTFGSREWSAQSYDGQHSKAHLVVSHRCVYIMSHLDMNRLWYKGNGCDSNSWPTFAAPTSVPTHIPSVAPTTPPTKDPTMAPSNAPSNAPSVAPSYAPTIAPTKPPSDAPTGAPSTSPTNPPTKNPTVNPSVSPSNAPSSDPTNVPTNVPTTDPTMEPTDNPTSVPTTDPTMDPTMEPSSGPTIDPTNKPTNNPTVDPSTDPTMDPTGAPTIDPTDNPTTDPTESPTNDPTKAPTSDPTKMPIKTPTNIPTIFPSISPTKAPTKTPTNAPSNAPSTKPPTNTPTSAPIRIVTLQPTNSPTTLPSFPTQHPTNIPTRNPTIDPTIGPTRNPTINPTTNPTSEATNKPTNVPTIYPSISPTKVTTIQPTSEPTFIIMSTMDDSAVSAREEKDAFSDQSLWDTIWSNVIYKTVFIGAHALLICTCCVCICWCVIKRRKRGWYRRARKQPIFRTHTPGIIEVHGTKLPRGVEFVDESDDENVIQNWVRKNSNVSISNAYAQTERKQSTNEGPSATEELITTAQTIGSYDI